MLGLISESVVGFFVMFSVTLFRLVNFVEFQFELMVFLFFVSDDPFCSAETIGGRIQCFHQSAWRR